MMRENKNKLRQEVRSRLMELTKEEHKELSNSIAENLFSLEEWKKAKTIGITISIPPEVPTVRIIEQAWSEGKEVAVPKCDPEKRQWNSKRFRPSISWSLFIMDCLNQWKKLPRPAKRNWM